MALRLAHKSRRRPESRQADLRPLDSRLYLVQSAERALTNDHGRLTETAPPNDARIGVKPQGHARGFAKLLLIGRVGKRRDVATTGIWAKWVCRHKHVRGIPR